jgi:putative protease
LKAGADAVYIGGTAFGARAYADNPEEEELLEAIDLRSLPSENGFT